MAKSLTRLELHYVTFDGDTPAIKIEGADHFEVSATRLGVAGKFFKSQLEALGFILNTDWSLLSGPGVELNLVTYSEDIPMPTNCGRPVLAEHVGYFQKWGRKLMALGKYFLDHLEELGYVLDEDAPPGVHTGVKCPVCYRLVPTLQRHCELVGDEPHQAAKAAQPQA